MARLLQPGREHVRTEMPAEHAQCQMSPGAFLLSCCKCYAVEHCVKTLRTLFNPTVKSAKCLLCILLLKSSTELHCAAEEGVLYSRFLWGGAAFVFYCLFTDLVI